MLKGEKIHAMLEFFATMKETLCFEDYFNTGDDKTHYDEPLEMCRMKELFLNAIKKPPRSSLDFMLTCYAYEDGLLKFPSTMSDENCIEFIKVNRLSNKLLPEVFQLSHADMPEYDNFPRVSEEEIYNVQSFILFNSLASDFVKIYNNFVKFEFKCSHYYKDALERSLEYRQAINDQNYPKSLNDLILKYL